RQELKWIVSPLKPAIWAAVQQPRHWVVGEGLNPVEMIVRPLRAVLKGQPSDGVLGVFVLIVPIARRHFQPEDAPSSDGSAVVKAEQGSDIMAASEIEVRKGINPPPEVAIHLGPERAAPSQKTLSPVQVPIKNAPVSTISWMPALPALEP